MQTPTANSWAMDGVHPTKDESDRASWLEIARSEWLVAVDIVRNV